MKIFSRIIFYALISELILGGGGRLTAVGPVSLRMVFFVVALATSLVYFVKGKRLPKTLTLFLVLFAGALVLALIIGISAGAERAFWIEDVKPLAYVFILPFFYFVSEDAVYFKHVPSLVIAGGLLLATAFFAILFLIHSGTIPFLLLYDGVSGSGEFFFRGETTFFYKGFIYVCIALIFSFFYTTRYKTAIVAALTVAILLTFTRGFIFGLALTYVFYAGLEKKYLKLVAGLVIAVAVLVLSKPVIYEMSSALHTVKQLDDHVPKEKLLGNRDESDSGRIQQAREVLAAITPVSILVGHGFGKGVPSRAVHMEISYLEIFHKQGVLGLLPWVFLCWLLLQNFLRTRQEALSKAFFFAAAFIFLQSLTNQFINNPIGLSFTLLALVYLHIRAINVDAGRPGVRGIVRHQKGDEISLTSA